MGKVFVGAEVGDCRIGIGCFNTELELLCKTSVAVESEPVPAIVADKIGRGIEDILQAEGLCLSDLSAAGVVGFCDGSLEQMITERLGAPVILENDTNAACWAEFLVGAGKGVNNIVFFNLGAEIGGGIIDDGRLVRGCDQNAAEVGHVIAYPDGRKCDCGQFGCVQAYASQRSIVDRAMEALGSGKKSSLKKVLAQKGEITCKDVYEHSAAGDELAKAITDRTAEVLGICCVNVVHATEPDRIIFGGEMIAVGDILLNRIKDYFDRYIWTIKKEPVEICFAMLGEDAAIIGAAAMARER